jgi:hypothetical protein
MSQAISSKEVAVCWDKNKKGEQVEESLQKKKQVDE